jgi:hypothetical protein
VEMALEAIEFEGWEQTSQGVGMGGRKSDLVFTRGEDWLSMVARLGQFSKPGLEWILIQDCVVAGWRIAQHQWCR